jgi:hypothetical protein
MKLFVRYSHIYLHIFLKRYIGYVIYLISSTKLLLKYFSKTNENNKIVGMIIDV